MNTPITMTDSKFDGRQHEPAPAQASRDIVTCRSALKKSAPDARSFRGSIHEPARRLEDPRGEMLQGIAVVAHDEDRSLEFAQVLKAARAPGDWA